MTRPLRVYSHDNGRCAVIGGYVYRGTRSRFARGLYVYGDFCTGSMWAIGRTSDGSYLRARVGDVGQLLNSFGEDGSRELYAVDHAGWLYRLVFHRR